MIVYQDGHIDCSFSFEIEDFQRVLRGSFIVYQNSDILPFIKIFRRGGGAFIISKRYYCVSLEKSNLSEEAEGLFYKYQMVILFIFL